MRYIQLAVDNRVGFSKDDINEKSVAGQCRA